MDKKGIFQYFTKPTCTKTEQNSQSANSTNQIPLIANCVNEESTSTIPKFVEQTIQYIGTLARISDGGGEETFSKKLHNKDFCKIFDKFK